MRTRITPTAASADGATSSAGSPDNPIVRAFAGLAVLGSGLVHFATAPAQSTPVLVLLAGLGAAELIMAVCVIAHRLRAGAFAAVLASVPLIVWPLLALTTDRASALPLGPMLTAAALSLCAALLLAASGRRNPARKTSAHPWVFAIALVVGAAVLPIVVVPALAAAQFPSGTQPSLPQIHEHHH